MVKILALVSHFGLLTIAGWYNAQNEIFIFQGQFPQKINLILINYVQTSLNDNSQRNLLFVSQQSISGGIIYKYGSPELVKLVSRF